MFIVKNCWGTPAPRGVCASKPRSFSSACKNFSQQRPLGPEIWSSKEVNLGGSESADSTVLLVDQSSLNAGGIALDHMSFQFWKSLSVPEIFASEV